MKFHQVYRTTRAFVIYPIDAVGYSRITTGYRPSVTWKFEFDSTNARRTIKGTIRAYMRSL